MGLSAAAKKSLSLNLADVWERGDGEGEERQKKGGNPFGSGGRDHPPPAPGGGRARIPVHPKDKKKGAKGKRKTFHLSKLTSHFVPFCLRLKLDFSAKKLAPSAADPRKFDLSFGTV